MATLAQALTGAPTDYNQWLYTPRDRKTTMPAPLSPLSGPGWQAPSMQEANDIARRYNGSGQPYTYNPSQPEMFGPPAPTGATGVSGDAGDSGQSIIDTAPRAVYTPPKSGGMAAPAQNSLQRWQQAGQEQDGMRPLSDQRRYFWSTGHIDASTRYANPANNKGAIAPVTFVNSPNQWVAW